ncbi:MULTISPECIES: hypothetical protein [Arenibacter]|jgi:hypothetical protein|uniref:Membrane protein n=1 Tax=Arenibacter algicola TaxID=616991 RepID=A0A221UVU6_9FLAO|nr:MULTISPECIES: hypothetical protein [Arenibacter]ASO05021.1 membrane protein [Arenibacter algicola]GBF18365.1 hypothetical protein C21_00523 [Arenibacter sp. NBRC 103722]HCO84671.1 hypothetical protein [Arenibacter sp.]|tara:strand:+ start:21216 stop:21419 length:204 start_codon:yes stop_codon:yes gene_type:complete
MNKILIVILIVLGLGLIAYNVTLVDFKEPFQGNSIIALIGILAALCAIVLLLIYSTSKKIQKKIEQD